MDTARGRQAMTTVVCEVGPATIRRYDAPRPGGQPVPVQADVVLARAALDAGDDTLTLLDDRPVAVEALWRRLFGSLLAGVTEVLLVHPSWWPPSRVEAVAGYVRTTVGNVVTRPRSWALALAAPDAVVIEVAPHLVVAMDAGVAVAAEPRTAPPDVMVESLVGKVSDAAPDRPVIVDIPVGVPGGDDLGAQVTTRLRGAGATVRTAGLDEIATTALDSAEQVPISSRRPRRWTKGLAATAAVLMAIAVLGVPRHNVDPRPPDVALIEGRVTMQIPAGWEVARVTDGPGSARVVITDPDGHEAALHLTQSRINDESLTATGAALRQAFDGRPANVFVDFDPQDQRAGREVVSYREVRPDHDIRWAVLVDGAVRIAIGCQSVPGGEEQIRAACDRALESARAVK